jgi:uncharacterized OB-fold protein
MDRLWDEENGECHPLAVTCSVCAWTSFPPATRCRYCGSTEVNEVRLSRFGLVEAASLMGDRLVVEVRTAEGVLLLGQAVPADRVRVGVRVRFSPMDQHMRFELDG